METLFAENEIIRMIEKALLSLDHQSVTEIEISASSIHPQLMILIEFIHNRDSDDFPNCDFSMDIDAVFKTRDEGIRFYERLRAFNLRISKELFNPNPAPVLNFDDETTFIEPYATSMLKEYTANTKFTTFVMTCEQSFDFDEVRIYLENKQKAKRNKG